MAGRGGRRGGRRVELERYRAFIDDWSAFRAAAARPEPTVFRVRSGRVAEAELLDRLRRRGFGTQPLSGMPGFYQIDEEPYPISMTIEHWDGLLYVQQASTGLAAPALGARPGERVLDLCAAPGGKTTHLAELMGDAGCLVASEIDERRIRGLLGNVYRLGHPNVVCLAADGRDFPAGALFDRVLVDAPCTGEGTLRRRSGDVPNQSETFLRYVRGVQRRLLERAVELCRPGGSILYVTCTFSPEENEAVVSDVLATCPVEIEPLSLDVPHAPGLASFEGKSFDAQLGGAARIYPHHLDSGGLFLAKMRRLEGEPSADLAGTASLDPGRGWSPVPRAFPGEPLAEQEAHELVVGALAALADRYGVPLDELERRGWIVRGGRVWMHEASEWPLDAWSEGAWRAVSIGLRAVELDSRGRPRPTNDFLRWLGRRVSRARVDLSAEALASLLGGTARPAPDAPPGPLALGLEGAVVGRGVATPTGLVSEIPKARAADLRRILDASAP